MVLLIDAGLRRDRTRPTPCGDFSRVHDLSGGRIATVRNRQPDSRKTPAACDCLQRHIGDRATGSERPRCRTGAPRDARAARHNHSRHTQIGTPAHSHGAHFSSPFTAASSRLSGTARGELRGNLRETASGTKKNSERFGKISQSAVPPRIPAVALVTTRQDTPDNAAELWLVAGGGVTVGPFVSRPTSNLEGPSWPPTVEMVLAARCVPAAAD